MNSAHPASKTSAPVHAYAPFVGRHIGPREDEIQEMLGKLGGRPPPGGYGTIATSPLVVAVGPSGAGVDLDLAR
jgi:hypothetical protein